MKKLLKFPFVSIALLFILLSCSKDDVTSSSSSGGSRAIKYEITGNYSGEIILVATTNNDDFEVIEIKKLPWKLEFNAKESIKTVIAQAQGSTPGVAGQTATLKTYVGGTEVSSGTGTALSSGFITLTNKVYILK
jgi:hypothetical protein